MDDLLISKRKKCKGCYPVVKLPNGDIYDLLKSSSKSNSDQIVEKDIYEERIHSCELCSGLIGNTTCRYSGNLIYETAVKSSQKCFYPGKSKW